MHNSCDRNAYGSQLWPAPTLFAVHALVLSQPFLQWSRLSSHTQKLISMSLITVLVHAPRQRLPALCEQFSARSGGW